MNGNATGPAVAQRSLEQRDPLLAFTGNAARGIMADINRLPRGKRVRALDNVLASFDPMLPGKVRQVATRLRQTGMPTNLAVERAVALSLADASVDKIRSIGEARLAGKQPVGLYGLGLGQESDTTSETETEEEKSAKKKVGQMFQGVICSDGVQTAVTDMVGRNQGQDAHAATNLGYEVAQGFAQCANLNQTPTPPTPPTTPPTTQEKPSLAVPIAVGVGALVVVGGFVWYTGRQS